MERELMEQSGLGVEVAAYSAPENLPQTLSMSGYFETVSLSEDDLNRADMYQDNFKRQAEQSRFSDYGEYLRSLDMRAFVSDFHPGIQQRVSQLINKTNQFNPTTRRYSKEETAAVQNSPDSIKIAARLADRFGDNGIVSAIAAGVSGSKITIDLFVMSCRVFRRNLEFVMFDELVRQSLAVGADEIIGVYIETKKNAVVKNLYPSLGFELLGEDGGEISYRYKIPKNYDFSNHEIEVLYEQE